MNDRGSPEGAPAKRAIHRTTRTGRVLVLVPARDREAPPVKRPGVYTFGFRPPADGPDAA